MPGTMCIIACLQTFAYEGVNNVNNLGIIH